MNSFDEQEHKCKIPSLFCHWFLRGLLKWWAICKVGFIQTRFKELQNLGKMLLTPPGHKSDCDGRQTLWYQGLFLFQRHINHIVYETPGAIAGRKRPSRRGSNKGSVSHSLGGRLVLLFHFVCRSFIRAPTATNKHPRHTQANSCHVTWTSVRP